MNCKISYHAVIQSVESLEPRFVMELEKEVFEENIRNIDLMPSETNTAIPGRPMQAIISIFKLYDASRPLVNSIGSNLNYPVTSPDNS
jgi:hypothetical protein